MVQPYDYLSRGVVTGWVRRANHHSCQDEPVYREPSSFLEEESSFDQSVHYAQPVDDGVGGTEGQDDIDDGCVEGSNHNHDYKTCSTDFCVALRRVRWISDEMRHLEQQSEFDFDQFLALVRALFARDCKCFKGD